MTCCQKKTHSVLGLLKMMRVEVVCTTDDPTDDLMYQSNSMGIPQN